MIDLKELFLMKGINSVVPQNLLAAHDFEIEAPVRIGGVKVVGKLKVGAFTYMHNGSLHNVEIGRYCSIGQDFTCLQPNHPLDWVSTHPFQYNDVDNVYGKELLNNLQINGSKKTVLVRNKVNKTLIGNDVWIGTGVTIVNGVKVGDGAVIGAGAMVTKDVPPYAIIGGNPAKIIRYRFEKDVSRQLLNSKWWDYNLLNCNYTKYDNPQEFLKYFYEAIENNSLIKFDPIPINKKDLDFERE